ncbi:hypothetical protein AK966_06755 [Vibrio sp. PID23_8]|nr:hypothetical protein AK966_06755 [Vibrio sp. PID23_8]
MGSFRKEDSKNKTIYLHIGAPKTGTSAIQYHLENESKYLLKHGFEYPDFGKGGGIIPSGNAT